MLWVLGFVISFFGLFIWLELGTMIPRSGGEKLYLEAAFPRPKHLTTVIFAANAILLGFSASNSIVCCLVAAFRVVYSLLLGFRQQVCLSYLHLMSVTYLS
jgi:amino acid transporter